MRLGVRRPLFCAYVPLRVLWLKCIRRELHPRLVIPGRTGSGSLKVRGLPVPRKVLTNSIRIGGAGCRHGLDRTPRIGYGPHLDKAKFRAPAMVLCHLEDGVGIDKSVVTK